MSVVIPVYNRLKFLGEAVDSVLGQTYPQVQLVIYDDGSEQAKLHQYYDSLTDPRVTVVRGTHVGIIGHSRNRGAEHATGEYIAFLDSDDLWHREKLSRQVPALEESEYRWSYGQFAMINERSEPIPIPSGRPALGKHGWILRDLLTMQTWIAINTVLMERSLFAEIGRFDESPALHTRDDYDLFMRIAEREPIHFLHDSVGWVREHQDRTTRRIDDGWARSAVLYERFLRRNSDPRLRRIAEKRLAYHLTHSLRMRRGEWRSSAWWSQWIKALRLIAGVAPSR